MLSAARALQASETKTITRTLFSSLSFKTFVIAGTITTLVGFYNKYRFNEFLRNETLDCDDDEYDDEFYDDQYEINEAK